MVAGLMVCFGAAAVLAPRPEALAQMAKKKKKEAEKKETDAPPPRPTDPKLIELHKEFLGKAEKLAKALKTLIANKWDLNLLGSVLKG